MLAAAVLVLPAASVAVTETVLLPWPSPVGVIEKAPVVASAVPVPTTVEPTFSTTVEPASARPLMVGSEVMPSAVDAPVSCASAKPVGAAGAALSSVVLAGAVAAAPPRLPAASVTAAV